MALLEDGKIFNIKCGIKDYTDEYGTNHTLEEYFNWFRQQFINALNISAEDFWMDWDNNSPFFQLPYINESDYYIPLVLDSSINKTNLLSSLSTNNNIFMEIGLGLFQNNKISNNYIYKDNDDNIYYATDTNINSNLNINNYTMFIINTNFLEDNGFYTIGVISTDKKIKEGYVSPSILVCDIINKFNNKRCDGVIFLNLMNGEGKYPYYYNTSGELSESNLGKPSISAYIPDFDENDEEQGEYELKGFFPQMFTPDESSFSVVKIHFGKLRPIKDIYLTKVTNTALSSFCYYQNMLEEKNSWKNFINTDIFNNKKTFSLGLNSSIINDIDLDNTENWIPAVEVKEKPKPEVKGYLEFSSDEDFYLQVSTKKWNDTMEYSVDDGSTWEVWDGSQINGTSTQNILVRGTGNGIVAGASSYRWTFTGKYIKGNIETLLDYKMVLNGKHPSMLDRCYYGMFYNCTSLTEAPELPATELTDYCYYYMFYHCTSLIEAPELPATKLANGCYSNMFRNCTSLTKAPELPATILANSCYNNMFIACTSLVKAPELPATTLTDYCYYGMFYNCISLTEASELPATTLEYGCYYAMFHGCTSLTKAPELPATTLAQRCYYEMFKYCRSLTKVSELPATTLAYECYYGMFSECASLTKLLKLPATKLASGCYGYMFSGCKKIKISTTQSAEYPYEYRIPNAGTGTAAGSALSGMFSGTGGTITGTPTINSTYYTSNEVV